MKIAYFSAEFGLDESLPIYSGGLGVLAGDHVKSASDLRLSLTGVGILYRKGYFQQRIHSDGTQEAVYLEMDPNELPVRPVLAPSGDPLFIGVPIANRTVFLKIWRAQAGQVPIYLMDADIEANRDMDRRLTDTLYGGDQETRISQEIILGIGGVRLFRALNIRPDVWHMNEGHVAFQTLERMREYIAQGIRYETALEAVKASTVFTTHTPVPAGHDQFSFELVERYLSDFWGDLWENKERVYALGRMNDRFNMTRFAVRTSAKVNAVSRLHAEVTKEMFHQWTPDIPQPDVPVLSVTNGIHTGSWLSPELKELYQSFLHPDWETRVAEPDTWAPVASIPDAKIWAAHQSAKRRMIARLGLPDVENLLTIGFARRFATYKRATLLFQDLDRLAGILNHPGRPACLIYAGKAHPADRPGQELIRRIAQVRQMERFRDRIFLIENYDMSIARHLVQGADVWLNTPIKPMEASGTSGQKAAINGVLNCSVLDGWWAEGYNGANGWAIPGSQQGTRQEQDRVDAEAFYQLMEQVIAPLYYMRRDPDLSNAWISWMKESIRSITPVFSTERMVLQYRDLLYQPAAERGKRFIDNSFEVAGRVADYKRFIRRNWDQVHVQTIDLHQESTGEPHCKLQAIIRLGLIWYKDVRVDAVASDRSGGICSYPLTPVKEIDPGVYQFEGVYPGMPQEWQDSGANVRVTPISPDFASDFELELTSWGTRWR